jgi:hypothetical protein
MTVNLSMLAGAGAQFFDNNGVILSGGLVYTYAAGTTTPQATYTTNAGSTAHTNPIVLDSAGRVPSGGEIWLTDSISYKFVLKTSVGVTIATYDNVPGNASGIYATFAASNGASLVGYTQGSGSAVATTVQAKLREVVSVKDFGAVGDGIADDRAAIQNAINYVVGLAGSKQLYFPSGTYKLASGQVTIPTCSNLILDAEAASFTGITGAAAGFVITNGNYNRYLFGTFESNSTNACISVAPTASGNGGTQNIYSWRSMEGTGGHIGFGFRIICDGAFQSGISVGRIIGANVRGFNYGISFEADNTGGGTHNIDTMQVNINYVFDNNVSINVGQIAGATINANTWFVNYEASFAGSIGFKTNGSFDTFFGTTLAASGATLNQLDSGALQNKFILSPPEKNIDGSVNFPGSTYLVDNSGNTTNSGTKGILDGSSSSITLSADQTGIANATWTKVLFNTKEWDDYSLFDTTNYRWVPGVIGRGRITAQATWIASVDLSLVEISVYKNGTIYKTNGTLAGATSSELTSAINCNVYIDALTDYFEIFVKQSTGTTESLFGLANLTWAQFEITRA